MRIFHRDVLAAETCKAANLTPATRSRRSARPGSHRPRRATDGLTFTRVVDSSGYVSFAGSQLPGRQRWRGRIRQLCIVAGSVQLFCDGHIVRVHAIQHDRAKEHARSSPNWRPATHRMRHRRRVKVHSCGVGLPASLDDRLKQQLWVSLPASRRRMSNA